MQLKHLLIAAVALLTAACLPVTSKVQVGVAKSDPALAGSWKAAADDKTTVWFHFIPQKDGSLTALMVTSKTKSDDSDWMQFKITTAQLGDAHYINAVEISDNGKAADPKDTGNIPLLYRYRNARTVALYLIDEKKAADAVRAKKISGTVEQGDNGDVRFTATAAEQDKFFQSKDGAALFTKPWMVLTKAN